MRLPTILFPCALIGLVMLAGTLLAGCATVDPTRFAEAANTLDPHCGKHVEVRVTPMLLFGWPVPIVSGEYVKDCAPDAAPALMRSDGVVPGVAP